MSDLKKRLLDFAKGGSNFSRMGLKKKLEAHKGPKKTIKKKRAKK